jgi:4-diphosphocytidyl-2-C-methyl-D-erythritol kinase
MRVRAFAKINRSLRVLGTRADGFHELRTIFQSIALHDTLIIRAVRGPFRLTCDDPACPVDDSNLIARAAARMWRASGRRGAPRDVAVHLRKRIPMQAGLGGGSSDAAAALRAFATRWRVASGKVGAAAAALGADVPYFLEGGAALGLERGDLLFPLADPPRAWVVLALPDFGVSTRDAFGWFDQRADTQVGPHSVWFGQRADTQVGPHSVWFDQRADTQVGPHNVEADLRADTQVGPHNVGADLRVRPSHELVNDLEAPVIARHPEIGRIISALRRSGASEAAMSGTGSAVFGLFSSRQAAVRAANRLTSASRRTLITRTLSRKTYQTLAATKPIG